MFTHWFLERSYRRMEFVWKQEDRATICSHAWEIDWARTHLDSVINLNLFPNCIPSNHPFLLPRCLFPLVRNHLVSTWQYTQGYGSDFTHHISLKLGFEIYDILFIYLFIFCYSKMFKLNHSSSGALFTAWLSLLLSCTNFSQKSVICFTNGERCAFCVCRWSGHWSNSATWMFPKTIWRWLMSRYLAVKTCRICCCPTTLWRSCQGL